MIFGNILNLIIKELIKLVMNILMYMLNIIKIMFQYVKVLLIHYIIEKYLLKI